jgi:hypothetical protein
LAKSLVRCPSPVSLKSLELLAHAGSTPAPGTNALVDLISVCEKSGEDQHPLCYGSALRLH